MFLNKFDFNKEKSISTPMSILWSLDKDEDGKELDDRK